MKAILLAAGYGTRLGELTADKPKSLIKVGSKPVIGHIVDKLYDSGITQIIVNIHYLPHKIPEYLGDRVLYYYEPVLLGHEGTIKALKSWIEMDDFMVINTDTLSNIDFLDMMKFHEDGTITVLMDIWRAAGTWIYPAEYDREKDFTVRPYRPKDLFWMDIGKPERLKEAQEMYEKDKFTRMP